MLMPPFSVIPVVDLKQHQVVHAVRGLRGNYQPLQSRLCLGSEPQLVCQALLALYPFKHVYVADLDAITHTGSHRGLITALARQYPHVQWWVDDGSAKPCRDWPGNVLPVLGTESSPQLNEFIRADVDYALSLDERGGEPLGDARLFQDTRHWPERIIAMTLAEVGSNCGPNLRTIKQYCTRHPMRQWFAAGGVRGLQDLRELRQAGAAGALIATALHTGQLGSDEINELYQDKDASSCG